MLHSIIKLDNYIAGFFIKQGYSLLPYSFTVTNLDLTKTIEAYQKEEGTKLGQKPNYTFIIEIIKPYRHILVKDYLEQPFTKESFFFRVITEIKKLLKTKTEPKIFEFEYPEHKRHIPKDRILLSRYGGEKIFNAKVNKSKILEIKYCNKNEYNLYHIPNLTFLKKLSLVGIDASDIDAEDLDRMLNFSKLKRLKFLELSDSKFAAFPKTIFNLPNLSTLILNNFPIGKSEKFPEEINKLKKLKELYIGFTSWQSLPKTIGNLKNLKKIRIIKTYIDTLPHSFYLLKNLEELVLKDIFLKKLLPTISNFKKLKILNVSLNTLTEIPYEIAELKNLETLNLSYNELTSLPESITNLENLKWLVLSYNNFESLPNGIFRMKNLRYLILKGNRNKKLNINKIKTDAKKNKYKKNLKVII